MPNNGGYYGDMLLNNFADDEPYEDQAARREALRKRFAGGEVPWWRCKKCGTEIQRPVDFPLSPCQGSTANPQLICGSMEYEKADHDWTGHPLVKAVLKADVTKEDVVKAFAESLEDSPLATGWRRS